MVRPHLRGLVFCLSVALSALCLAACSSPDENTGAVSDAASETAAACPGGVACPCASNADCGKPKLCIETLDGRRCAAACTDSCAEGQSCLPVAGINACLPTWGLLCQPCSAAADCAVEGLKNTACVRHGAEAGSFCGAPCVDTADCPADFRCDIVNKVAGGTVKQCVPDGKGGTIGACTCGKAAVDSLLTTPCQLPWTKDGKTIGTCKGERSCSSDGLSACTKLSAAIAVHLCSTTDCADGGIGPCDDGDPCTKGEKCFNGQCVGGTNTCACTADGDCFDDDNVCNGKPYCAKDKLPWSCKPNPATVITCDGSGDTDCLVNTCHKGTGECSEQPATGDACDDGDACTAGTICDAKGDCGGGTPTCSCTSDDECAKLDDGDKCNGTFFCDKASQPYTCKLNPATVISCQDPDDGDCLQNACQPASGACKLVPLPDNATCSDDIACTLGDHCKGGDCVPGTACACNTDSDCTDKDDGDKCNGVPFCDKTTGTCQPNPATVVNCKTVDDTACLQVQCEPTSGQCVGKAVNEDGPCDDNNACTPADTCVGGKCTGGTSTCLCKTDADCAKQDDGNLCNGSLFCDKSGDQAVCALNPASKVVCQSVDDTFCAKNLCQKKTGKCVLTPTNDGETCDADNNACTPVDQCKAATCTADANVCDCQVNADCAAKEDGDPCNGTLYCDKTLDKPKCVVNPATVITCPTVDDTACNKNLCQPKTGTCSKQLLADNSLCDDGNPCSAGDRCKAGACTPGLNICKCQSNADCAADEDGNLCNGTLYCDKSGKTPLCVVNPATLKTCPAPKSSCQVSTCQPKSGTCTVTNLGDGLSCSDGNACTTKDACKEGACTGTAKDCDDAIACTVDGCLAGGCSHVPDANACKDAKACEQGICDPLKGCQYAVAKDGAPCADGDACLVGSTCTGGKCGGGQLKSCDDSIECTKDSCLAGVCKNVADDSACDDGNSCTLNTCAGGKCKVDLPKEATCGGDDKCVQAGKCESGKCIGKPVVCDDGNGCTKDQCTQEKGCQHAPVDGAPCDDGSACTKGDVCDGQGGCTAGKPLLFNLLFTGGLGDHASAISSLKGGGWLVAGTQTDAATLRPTIRHVDEVGQVQAVTAYKPAGGKVFGVLQLADGQVVAVGHLESKTHGKQILVARVDVAKGQWQVEGNDGIGGLHHDRAVDVVARPEGGWIVMGTRRTPAKVAEPWIAAWDGAGKQVLDRTQAMTDSTVSIAAAMAKGVLFSLVQTGIPGGTITTLARTNPKSGSTLGWVRLGGQGHWLGRDLVQVDGGFAVVGQAPGVGKDPPRIWLARTDGLGQVLWHRFYGAAQLSDAFGLAALNEGFALAGKRVTADGKGSHRLVLRTDSVGRQLALRTLPPGGPDRAVAIIGANNQLLVAGGHGDGSGKDRWWIERMDAFGHSGCGGSGKCFTWAPATCSDGNSCTLDGCDPKSGCKSAPTTGDCTMAGECSVGGACTNGKCSSKGPRFGDVPLNVGDAPDTITGVVALADGGALLGGRTGKVKKGGHWLRRLDADGSVRWTKAFGQGDEQGIGGVAALTTERQFAVGYVTAGGQKSQGWYGRIDEAPDGTVSIQEKTFGGTEQDVLVHIAVINSDSVVAVGTTASIGEGGKDIWALRIREGGSVAWQTPLGGPGDDEGVAVVAQGEGAAVLGAATLPGVGKMVGVLSLSAGGQQRWIQVLGGTSGNKAGALTALPDGDLAVALSVGSADGSFAVRLVRLDAAGALVWQRDLLGAGNRVPKAIVNLPEGLALAGTQIGADKKMRGFAQATDLDGQHGWQYAWTTGDARFPITLARLANGDLMAAGSSISKAGTPAGWLTRMSPWGHDDCTAAGKCGGVPANKCDDDMPCTMGKCAASSGICSQKLVAGRCDDGKACTTLGTCSTGKCASGTVRLFTGDSGKAGHLGGSASASTLVRHGDGRLFVATGGDTGKGPRVVEVNDGGKVLGQTALVGGPEDQPIRMALDGAGGLLLAVSTGIGSSARAAVAGIQTTTGNPKVAWQKVFGMTGVTVHDAAAAQIGELAVVGGRGEGAAAKPWWGVAMADGQIGLEKEINASDTTPLRAVADVGSDYWMALGGKIDQNVQRLWMVPLHTDNQSQFQGVILPLGSGDMMPVGIDYGADERFVVAGDETKAQASWLAATDKVGKIAWTRKIPGQGGAAMSRLVPMAAGGWALLGQHGGGGGWLARIASNSQALFQLQVKVPGQSGILDAISLPGGDLVGVWNTDNENKPTARMFRMDDAGATSCAASGGCVGAVAQSCDDGDPCTLDWCAGGVCQHLPADVGTVCGNGAICLAGGACQGSWAAKVVVGRTSTCAVHANSLTSCWGDNSKGQLAVDNGNNASGLPLSTVVKGAKQLSLGWAHGCAALFGGHNSCWGDNTAGQVDKGYKGAAHQPTSPLSSKVTAMAAGKSHSCALGTDSKVTCWGANDRGQLGLGGATDKELHAAGAPVQNMLSVTALSAGTDHTCAVSKQQVFCWGRADLGQLGAAAGPPAATMPVSLQGLGAVTTLSAGSQFTCALSTGGEVWCWGDNAGGQVEPAKPGLGPIKTPKKIGGITDAIGIAAGDRHACALLSKGEVWCWGDPAEGATGQKDLKTMHAAKVVPGVANATGVVSRYRHTCTVHVDGQVTCWGRNVEGQLGKGTTDAVGAPIAVAGSLPK